MASFFLALYIRPEWVGYLADKLVAGIVDWWVNGLKIGMRAWLYMQWIG